VAIPLVPSHSDPPVCVRDCRWSSFGSPVRTPPSCRRAGMSLRRHIRDFATAADGSCHAAETCKSRWRS